MQTAERLPRLLLVEDDAAIRQFVALAVEDEPVQLVSVPTLQAARQAIRLAGSEFALVLLDMMLPDGSGMELLKDPVRMRPDLRARWVVFSAGVPAAMRAQLSGLGVDEVLDKPVSLDRLLHCIKTSCSGWMSNPAPVPDPPVAHRQQSVAALAGANERVESTPTLSASEIHAVQTYFFGQHALFLAMKEHTLKRLPDDICALEKALKDQNAGQLQRAAHNLKSVARMLGQPKVADFARALENAATQSDANIWQGLWLGLRNELTLWQSQS